MARGLWGLITAAALLSACELLVPSGGGDAGSNSEVDSGDGSGGSADAAISSPDAAQPVPDAGSAAGPDAGRDAGPDAAAPPDAGPACSVEVTGTWDIVQQGVGSYLSSVHGTAANDIWVAGDGAVLHYNGSGWGTVSTGSGVYLFHAVRAISPDEVWAAGFSVALHWKRGSAWEEVGSVNCDLGGIWDNGANDVWFAGSYGQLLHWTGGSDFAYRSVGVSTTMRSMWGFGPSDIWAGAMGELAHFDGTQWGLVDLPSNPLALHAVWGSKPDDLWTVGTAGYAAHYDGLSWTVVPNPASAMRTPPVLHGIWGSCPGDVWAVGDGGILLHWNGAEWTQVTSPTPSEDLLGVWGTSSHDVWAVGTRGTILHYH